MNTAAIILLVLTLSNGTQRTGIQTSLEVCQANAAAAIGLVIDGATVTEANCADSLAVKRAKEAK